MKKLRVTKEYAQVLVMNAADRREVKQVETDANAQPAVTIGGVVKEELDVEAIEMDAKEEGGWRDEE